MHTCISSHGLKRSWHSCPRWVNIGNKNTPSMHHPRRRNVTTLMVGWKKTVTYAKISPKSGEPQRYSWGMQNPPPPPTPPKKNPQKTNKSALLTGRRCLLPLSSLCCDMYQGSHLREKTAFFYAKKEQAMQIWKCRVFTVREKQWPHTSKCVYSFCFLHQADKVCKALAVGLNILDFPRPLPPPFPIASW